MGMFKSVSSRCLPHANSKGMFRQIDFILSGLCLPSGRRPSMSALGDQIRNTLRFGN